MITLLPTSTIVRESSEKLFDTFSAIATLSTPNVLASLEASSTTSLDSHITQLCSTLTSIAPLAAFRIVCASAHSFVKAEANAITTLNCLKEQELNNILLQIK